MPVPVSHAVPTLGLVVDDGEAVVAFPSDTGPTEEFWKPPQRIRSVGCSFS